MSREEALTRLAEPLYDASELETDLAFFCKKMQITRGQLDELMTAPVHHYSDFPNQDRLLRIVKTLQRVAGVVLGRPITVYS